MATSNIGPTLGPKHPSSWAPHEEHNIPTKRPDFPKGYFDGDEEKVLDDNYDAWACPSCEHESPGKCGFCGMCGRQKPAKADSDSEEGSSVGGGA